MGADNSKDKKSPVDHFKQAFGDVRILVIGGSGSGKSALIRCMGFGDELVEVPQSVHRRAAGQQDIAKVPVWKHPELPLFIHDTNGVGSNGKARVADISKFLETDHPWPHHFWRRIWRAAPSISDRVHLVWFVLSATDNRILEFNVELMKLVGKHRIPVQIIVTHLDQVTAGAYNRNVGNHLDELLAAAGLSADASQKLKGSIVKVGLAQRGDLEDDAHADEDAEERVKQQKQALRELSRKTTELLDEKQQGQRLTWAAAQSVDVRAKLQETAKLVVCRQYLEWAEYFSPAVVSVDKKALLSLLRVVRDNIGAIWGAPPALKEAVWETVGVWSDGLKTPLLLQLLSMAVTVPVAAPIAFGLVSWFFAFWEQTRGSGFRKVFVTYSLLVAACFMLVRTRDPVTWASRTVQEYTRLLQDELVTKGLKRMLQSGKIRSLLGLYGQDNVEEVEAFTEYFEEEEAVQRG